MIVFFLPDLRGGGAERVMLNLLERFAKHEQNVVLLLGRKKGDLMSQIPENVKVYELNSGSALKSVIPFIKFCNLHKPTKVFASLGSSLATSLARPFISKKIQIINRLGNTIGAEKNLLKSKFKKRLYIGANQVIAKFSDKLIFQCHYMANDFIKETGVTPKSYKVIYNPVNTLKVRELGSQDVIKDFDFLAVGRLSPQKDYGTLIKAFKLLKDGNKKLPVLKILGEGELREALEKEISLSGLDNNIMITGFVSNPYSLMKQADAIISTSLFEGFSNVIVESLCLGTPIIASDCPGANNEVITEGINGFLFETSNAESLARVISTKWKEIKSLEREQIKKEAISRYNVNLIFDNYSTYLNK